MTCYTPIEEGPNKEVEAESTDHDFDVAIVVYDSWNSYRNGSYQSLSNVYFNIDWYTSDGELGNLNTGSNGDENYMISSGYSYTSTGTTDHGSGRMYLSWYHYEYSYSKTYNRYAHIKAVSSLGADYKCYGITTSAPTTTVTALSAKYGSSSNGWYIYGDSEFAPWAYPEMAEEGCDASLTGNYYIVFGRTYKHTFVDNTGVSTYSLTKTLDIGSSVTLPDIQSYSSTYTFKGWNNNGTVYSSGSTRSASYQLCSNTTYSAVWEKPVTLYGNGGTFSNGSTSISDNARLGSTFSAYLAEPTRAGYAFAGWKTSTGASFDSSQIATINNIPTELYAQWSANTISVTLDADGGTIKNWFTGNEKYVSTKSAVYGGTYGDLPVPTKPGYTFEGWSKNYFDVQEFMNYFNTQNSAYISTDSSAKMELSGSWLKWNHHTGHTSNVTCIYYKPNLPYGTYRLSYYAYTNGSSGYSSGIIVGGQLSSSTGYIEGSETKYYDYVFEVHENWTGFYLGWWNSGTVWVRDIELERNNYIDMSDMQSYFTSVNDDTWSNMSIETNGWSSWQGETGYRQDTADYNYYKPSYLENGIYKLSCYAYNAHSDEVNTTTGIAVQTSHEITNSIRVRGTTEHYYEMVFRIDDNWKGFYLPYNYGSRTYFRYVTLSRLDEESMHSQVISSTNVTHTFAHTLKAIWRKNSATYYDLQDGNGANLFRDDYIYSIQSSSFYNYNKETGTFTFNCNSTSGNAINGFHIAKYDDFRQTLDSSKGYEIGVTGRIESFDFVVYDTSELYLKANGNLADTGMFLNLTYLPSGWYSISLDIDEISTSRVVIKNIKIYRRNVDLIIRSDKMQIAGNATYLSGGTVTLDMTNVSGNKHSGIHFNIYHDSYGESTIDKSILFAEVGELGVVEYKFYKDTGSKIYFKANGNLADAGIHINLDYLRNGYYIMYANIIENTQSRIVINDFQIKFSNYNVSSVFTKLPTITPYGETSNLLVLTNNDYDFGGWSSSNSYVNYYNKVFEFDGTQHLNLGQEFLYKDEITISVNVYMDNWTDLETKDMRLLSCIVNGGWSIEVNDSKLCFAVCDGSYKYVNATKTLTQLGTKSWHTLTLTWDGKTAKFFIDGSLQSSLAISQIVYDKNAPLIIGGESADYGVTIQRFFTGKVKQITILDKALSDSEVANDLANDTFVVRGMGIDQVMVADWISTISFDANGGDGIVPSDMFYRKNMISLFTLPTNNLIRAGFLANGWNKSEVLTSTPVYADGTIVSIDGNSCFYANWDPQGAKLQFDINSYASIIKEYPAKTLPKGVEVLITAYTTNLSSINNNTTMVTFNIEDADNYTLRSGQEVLLEFNMPNDIAVTSSCIMFDSIDKAGTFEYIFDIPNYSDCEYFPPITLNFFDVWTALKYEERLGYFYFESGEMPQTAVSSYDSSFNTLLTNNYENNSTGNTFESNGITFMTQTYTYESSQNSEFSAYSGQRFLGFVMPSTRTVILQDPTATELTYRSYTFTAGMTYWFRFDPIKWRVSNYGVEKTDVPTAWAKFLDVVQSQLVVSEVLWIGAFNDQSNKLGVGSVVTDATLMQTMMNGDFLGGTNLKISNLSATKFIGSSSYAFVTSSSGNIKTSSFTSNYSYAEGNNPLVATKNDILSAYQTDLRAYASQLVAVLSGKNQNQFFEYWTCDFGQQIGCGTYVSRFGEIMTNSYYSFEKGIRLSVSLKYATYIGL